MSMFRTFEHGIFQRYRNISLLINVGHYSHRETWHVVASNYCVGSRLLASYAGLASDKKYWSGFEELAELTSADENVRRIFSLKNASQLQKTKILKKELMETCSTPKERQLAKQTIKIANLEDHLEETRNKDKHNKVFYQWLKDQHIKKLKSIKTNDFERYVELVKRFNIEPLESTHTKYSKYKFRQFKIGVEIKEKKSLAVRKSHS